MENQFKTKKEIVDIKLVHPNKWNPNKQSDFIFKKEVESIKTYGFVGSIVVREDGVGTYEIIDGEHRYKAALELKYTQIAVENAGEISVEDAKTLLFLLNMRGKDDLEKQVAIFDTLQEGQMQLLPFTEEEIKRAKDLVKFDFSRYDTEKEIEDKKESENRTLMFALTDDEYELIGKVFQAMRRQGKKTDKECLMSFIQNWCEMNIMQKADGSWEFEKESYLKKKEKGLI